MKRINRSKIISFMVMLISTLVMIGWIFNIQMFKSILPIWVTMKFSTALCFFLSGLTLYFIIEIISGEKAIAHVIIPITTLIILIIMGTLLASTFLEIRTGIEDLFVKEKINAIKTTTPGRPSVGTMLSFILIVIAAIYSIISTKNLSLILNIIGIIVSIIGSIAIIGYIINMPILYYTVKNISTAMSFHTAALFIIIGLGFINAKNI